MIRQEKVALVNGGSLIVDIDTQSGNIVGARADMQTWRGESKPQPHRVERHTAVIDGTTKIAVDYDPGIRMVVNATWDGQEISNDELMQRLEGLVRAVGLYA